MSHVLLEAHPPGSPAVEARGITLAYGAHVALSEATFAFPVGQVTSLIGPNGSGKSTLLDAIAGLRAPDAGTVTVLGDRAPRRRTIAYVLQALHANDQLPVSAREVVTMGRYGERGMLRRLTRADRQAVDRAMERLDVARFARRQVRTLSGGERQRVLVAQALVQDAPLLLLDEPITGLDIPSRETILQVVGEERARGTTVVISTHNLAEAAEADHLLLLAGRVVAAGRPSDVLTTEHLSAAYGGMVLELDGRPLVVDDGSHHVGDAVH